MRAAWVGVGVGLARTLIDHLLQLLVGHILAELLGDALEVLERDLAGLVVVEEAEGLQDLLPRVLQHSAQNRKSIISKPHRVATGGAERPPKRALQAPEMRVRGLSATHLLAHLRGHHLQELIEVDRARAVLRSPRHTHAVTTNVSTTTRGARAVAHAPAARATSAPPWPPPSPRLPAAISRTLIRAPLPTWNDPLRTSTHNNRSGRARAAGWSPCRCPQSSF